MNAARIVLIGAVLLALNCAAREATTGHVAHAKSAGQCVKNSTFPYILPRSVIPRRYSLNFTLPSPNSGNLNYTGDVEIQVRVLQQTSCIIIHSYGLRYGASSVYFQPTMSGKKREPTSVDFDQDKQWAVINFDHVLPLGHARLYISQFTGVINNQSAHGLFLSDNSFTPQAMQPEEARAMFKRWENSRGTSNPSSRDRFPPASLRQPSIADNQRSPTKSRAYGQGQKMFATQFEVSSARTAFPCFDEPELKAHYKASFTVPSDDDLTVLFNTENMSTTIGPDGNAMTIDFGPTPHPMSSYLVAFAVGRFDYVERNSKNVTYRIYTPKGASRFGEFALNVSVAITEYFSELWSFPYSRMNPKMDQISVPAIIEDAMENWGLLTYYPYFLLVDSDPGKHTLEQLQMVALVTVHEISHQWFGDTITFPFWTQCYLNEGFARFLQFVGVDHLFPEWYIWTLGGFNSYYNFAYESSMQEDITGLSGSVIHAPSPLDGQAAYDGNACNNIAYGKGGSLNRFFSRYLADRYPGNDTWNSALSRQLHDHTWKNPSVYDLMDSFVSAGVSRSIADKFLDWLTRPGFPVVSLSLDRANGVVTAVQRPISKAVQDTSPWWVAMNVTGYSANGTALSTFVLDFDTASTTRKFVDNGNSVQHVQGNGNYTAYVLVTYDDPTWEWLLSSLSSVDQNPPVDRDLMISSLFYLVSMSHEKATRQLNYTSSLASPLLLSCFKSSDAVDRNYALSTYTALLQGWFPISAILQESNSAASPINSGLLSSLLRPMTSLVGWGDPTDPDDSVARQMRALVLFWSVYYGDASVIDDAIKIFDGQQSVLPELKSVVYYAVGSNGGDDRYAALVRLYQGAAAGSQEKASLLFALTTNPSEANCQNTLKLVQTDASTTAQAKLQTLSTMMAYNQPCRLSALVAYTQLAPSVWKQSGPAATSSILNGFAPVLSTQVQYGTVQQFLMTNVQYLTREEAQNALTRILLNGDMLAFNQ